MKKIIICLVGVLAFCSCADNLSVEPKDSVMTDKQLKEGAAVSKSRAEAGLAGMYGLLNAFKAVNRDVQYDWGYPSMMSSLEHYGDGVVSTTTGYNWFSGELLLKGRTKEGSKPAFFWSYIYKYIKASRDIVSSLDPKDEDSRGAFGQASAFRAFAYFLGAQLYQQTYVGNEDKLCIPIVDVDTNILNNPRATVKEVYELILSDLDNAIKYIPDGDPVAKNYISKAVAYGLRSRVHLVMNNWSAAATDAQAAIDATTATPFTIEDCSVPNFDDVATGANSMWGIIITKEDKCTISGIQNWTSMFTSLCFGASAYTTAVGCYKRINTRLFDKISDTDVRKGWWAHEKIEYAKDKDGKSLYRYTSPLLNKAYAPALGFEISKQLLPHSVLKFAPNNKNPNDDTNAVDFQLMRVEEMYYNLAEAKAMGGDIAGGKKVLEDFVKTYRDPSYSCSASTDVDFQNEIYLQKRVEFWGEGISWFDMMRMKKGLDRVDVANKDNGGYPTLTRFNVPAGDDILIFQIPLSEEQANKGVEGKNNPRATEPKDMM